MLAKPWKKRPQFAPREIRVPQPGVSYPDEYGLQFKLQHDGVCHREYFAYRDFRDDALAAHRAAAKWREALRKKLHAPARGRGPSLVEKGRPNGTVEVRLVVSIALPNGRRTKKAFYVGLKHQVTDEHRDLVARRAAKFYDDYQAWRAGKGVHPMERQ